jgi:hypothetical protein
MGLDDQEARFCKCGARTRDDLPSKPSISILMTKTGRFAISLSRVVISTQKVRPVGCPDVQMYETSS